MSNLYNYLDIELQDDETVKYGGVSFKGETLKDFLDDAGIGYWKSVDAIDVLLKKCGIKTITETVKELNNRPKLYVLKKDNEIAYASTDTMDIINMLNNSGLALRFTTVEALKDELATHNIILEIQYLN
ncbi:hypothetical protein VL10_ORF18 [Staphylococcus phage vB_SauM_VL10]|nr:hypothetical protein VL10_ORF18 [Staphylococcus phage vB_SauM_VL10]